MCRRLPYRELRLRRIQTSAFERPTRDRWYFFVEYTPPVLFSRAPTTLGHQAKLHSYNAVLLKVKSLHAWSDPGRTKVWVAAVSLLAAVLAIVPARYVCRFFPFLGLSVLVVNMQAERG